MKTFEKPAISPESQVLRSGRFLVKRQGLLFGWVWKVKSVALTDEALVTGNYKIPLDRITKVERVDVKPYCLLLEAANKRYHLSFQNDGELYDWQEDVYSRCPLIGTGSPFGFVHDVHVGFEPDSGAFTGLPSNWTDSLIDRSSGADNKDEKFELCHKRGSQGGSNPLRDTPALGYTAPPGQFATSASQKPMVLNGRHPIKADGLLTGWIWKARWLVLDPQTLTIYKSQGSRAGISIILRDITSVERANSKMHCLLIETKSGKRYTLAFGNDEELYNWRDQIYSRSAVAGNAISMPVNFVHNIHIGIDPTTGEFTGLPDQWRSILQDSLPVTQ